MEAPPPSRFSIRIDNFVDDDTGTTFYRTSCDLLLDDRGSMIRRFSAARRYSEFKAMHAELAPQLEKLPSKFLVPKRLRHSHSAKLQRASALQEYLTAVVAAVGDQAVPPALAKFLSLDAEASLDQSDLSASLKRKKDISNSIVADAVGAVAQRVEDGQKPKGPRCLRCFAAAPAPAPPSYGVYRSPEAVLARTAA